jgi:hypothetical protein
MRQRPLGGTGGGSEHRKDPAAHAALAHPRKIEMTRSAAHPKQRGIVSSHRVVVTVEHRQQPVH